MSRSLASTGTGSTRCHLDASHVRRGCSRPRSLNTSTPFDRTNRPVDGATTEGSRSCICSYRRELPGGPAATSQPALSRFIFRVKIAFGVVAGGSATRSPRIRRAGCGRGRRAWRHMAFERLRQAVRTTMRASGNPIAAPYGEEIWRCATARKPSPSPAGGSLRRSDPGGAGIRRRRCGRGFSYLGAGRGRDPRPADAGPHQGPGDPARLGGRLDLRRSAGPHPGHGHRRGGTPPVPVPRPVAGAAGPGQARPGAGVRGRPAAHPRGHRPAPGRPRPDQGPGSWRPRSA